VSERRKRDEALARVREIAQQLRELEARAAAASSTEVELSLLERAAELADEATRLLEGAAEAPS
jgi:uncharacterized protein involved in exopolysaccharide biosynthesis